MPGLGEPVSVLTHVRTAKRWLALVVVVGKSARAARTAKACEPFVASLSEVATRCTKALRPAAYVGAERAGRPPKDFGRPQKALVVTLTCGSSSVAERSAGPGRRCNEGAQVAYRVVARA